SDQDERVRIIIGGFEGQTLQAILLLPTRHDLSGRVERNRFAEEAKLEGGDVTIHPSFTSPALSLCMDGNVSVTRPSTPRAQVMIRFTIGTSETHRKLQSRSPPYLGIAPAVPKAFLVSYAMSLAQMGQQSQHTMKYISCVCSRGPPRDICFFSLFRARSPSSSSLLHSTFLELLEQTPLSQCPIYRGTLQSTEMIHAPPTWKPTLVQEVTATAMYTGKIIPTSQTNKIIMTTRQTIMFRREIPTTPPVATTSLKSAPATSMVITSSRRKQPKTPTTTRALTHSSTSMVITSSRRKQAKTPTAARAPSRSSTNAGAASTGAKSTAPPRTGRRYVGAPRSATAPASPTGSVGPGTSS
ncbi:hypothetical protein QBC33DRAFT_605953, partial [Phialemonium atrogriseum]